MSDIKPRILKLYPTLHELVADVIAKHEEGYAIDEFDYPRAIGFQFQVAYNPPEAVEAPKASVGRPKAGAK